MKKRILSITMILVMVASIGAVAVSAQDEYELKGGCCTSVHGYPSIKLTQGETCVADIGCCVVLYGYQSMQPMSQSSPREIQCLRCLSWVFAGNFVNAVIYNYAGSHRFGIFFQRCWYDDARLYMHAFCSSGNPCRVRLAGGNIQTIRYHLHCGLGSVYTGTLPWFLVP